MPRSEALIRAMKKYETEKVERVTFRVPKGKKEFLQAHAAKQGESLNAFLTRAVDEAIQRDAESKK